MTMHDDPSESSSRWNLGGWIRQRRVRITLSVVLIRACCVSLSCFLLDLPFQYDRSACFNGVECFLIFFFLSKTVRSGAYVSKRLKNYNQNKEDAMAWVKKQQRRQESGGKMQGAGYGNRHHLDVDVWLEETIANAKKRSGAVGGGGGRSGRW